MGKPIDTNDKAIYNEGGSWGRLSEGWPEIKHDAYGKYVLCNMTGILPYGSYVLMGKNNEGPLRVVDEAAKKRLNDAYRTVKRVILDVERELTT